MGLYMGIVFDSKTKWDSQAAEAINKSIRTLHMA